MLLVFAFYDTFFVPLQFAFNFSNVFQSTAFVIVDNSVDVCYLIDFILNFCQSFYDVRGFEQRNSRKIAKNYMNSNQFKYDILTIIGSGFITGSYPFLKFLQFFKITRIRKIGNFIEHLTVTREIKASLNIVKIIIYLLLFLHNYACLWWRVVKYHGQSKFIFDFSG